MKKRAGNFYTLAAVIIFALVMSSCNATMHTVGAGGRGDCKSVGQYDAKKKQWYILWGLAPLNHVDSKTLAGGATDYTIRTTRSFGDLLIAIPGSYLLGIQSQTIRVSKAKQ